MNDVNRFFFHIFVFALFKRNSYRSFQRWNNYYDSNKKNELNIHKLILLSSF